jgi:hypothetical protein
VLRADDCATTMRFTSKIKLVQARVICLPSIGDKLFILFHLPLCVALSSVPHLRVDAVPFTFGTSCVL